MYNGVVMSHKKILRSGIIIESIAKLLIINEKNEALILTIGEYKAHPEKSYSPDLPGGQVEIGDGETELAGVIREAREEAGIILQANDIFLAYTRTGKYKKEGTSVSLFLYIAQLNYSPDVLISWEHASYEWIPIDKVLKTKTFDMFYQEAIQYAVETKLL